MRAATVVIVGIAAALLAPVLAAPPARGLGVGQGAPSCAMALALPQELRALVRAREADSAPCSPEIVLLTTPLTLVEISTKGIAHIWAQPAPAPNARIEKAHQVIRQAYETVMDGLASMAANAPPTDAAAKQQQTVSQ
ncbi:MAG: hypothetical protein RJB58_2421 [Pseudomonadota bacterium]|jgi:hypothetical protein